MNADILFFFRGHADALPLYQQLETLILQQTPDAVMVGSLDALDEELMGWLREAAEFSAGKR